MLVRYCCPRVVQERELMRLPGVYGTFKNTRKKCASDVAADDSGTGVKQGCALQKHSYSARGATKMLLGILFASLDASIERTGYRVRERLPTFAGFPTFRPMTFHLLASYSLIAASKAALCSS